VEELQAPLPHQAPWDPTVSTNLRSSQHFRNLQIDQMVVRRQKRNSNNQGHNILNRLAAADTHTPKTLWAILDMGDMARHLEVLIVVPLRLAEVWVPRVRVRMVVTRETAWPVPRGSDLRLVPCQRLRRRPPGARTAFRGFTKWMITLIGGLSSTSC